MTPWEIPQCLHLQNPAYGKFYRANNLSAPFNTNLQEERFGRRIFEAEDTSQPNEMFGPYLHQDSNKLKKKLYETIGKI